LGRRTHVATRARFYLTPSLLLLHMPMLLTWEYGGGVDGSAEAARRGTQRAYSGDTVIDDVHGQGMIDRLDGTILIIQFGR